MFRIPSFKGPTDESLSNRDWYRSVAAITIKDGSPEPEAAFSVSVLNGGSGMLNRLSLRAKLAIVFVACAVPVFVALLLAAASSRDADSALRRLIAVDERAKSDATSIAFWTLQCRRYEKDMFLNSADAIAVNAYEQKWNAAIENLKQSNSLLAEHIQDVEIQEEAHKFEEMRQLYEAAVRDVVAAIRDQPGLSPADANAAMTPHKNTVRGLIDLSSQLSTNLERRCAGVEAVIAIKAKAADGTLRIVALFVGVFGLAITMLMPRLLASRLGKVVAFAEELRGGNRSTRCAIAGTNEAARVSTALNNMLDDLECSVAREVQANAAQLQAQRLGEMKTKFLANMSHEIRTPLTAILGFTDILLENGKKNLTPGQRAEMTKTIRNAGRHLLTLINDILDLSKIEAERMTVETIETPLVVLLLEIESLLRPRASSRDITLQAILATPLPDRVMSDPTRLRQILMNLAGNAIKFTEKGGVTLTAGIQTFDSQSRLVIDVEDTGVGMNQQQAGRVFDAFCQADVTVTRKHGGTGLGLAISRRLANLMGGDIKLLRTELGNGSCFRLILPVEAALGSVLMTDLGSVKVAEASKSAGEVISLNGNILLVEDGPDNQRLIAFHLRKAGAVVAIADNGRVALEMVDKAEADGKPYDILLTDMQMPELDGYTLARTLRQRGNMLPIVALTAHAMSEDKARCKAAGCDDYASKPIDKNALLAVCATWMDKTHTHDASTSAEAA